MASLPDKPRPVGGVGMKLHLFPPDTTQARRRRIRLVVAFLAVTAWGVVSVRQANMGLADYGTATAELVEELPYLIAAGQAVVAEMLRAGSADGGQAGRDAPPSAIHDPVRDPDDAD
jgi:hypothetical protein